MSFWHLLSRSLLTPVVTVLLALAVDGVAQSAPSAPTSRVVLSIGPAALGKLDIVAEQISSVNLTADGRRLVIVVHRPGQKARLVELEATSGRVAADIDIDLDYVQTLATNADGSQALAVGDYAGKAVHLDVVKRMCTTVFTKASSAYRFSLPVSLTHAPDGSWITRGYTVDKDGVPQGDELTALRVESGKTLVTTRLLDLDTLLRESGVAKGQVLALNRTADGRTIVCSVASSATSCTLFMQSAEEQKPRALLTADSVNAITIDAKGTFAYCTLSRRDGGELVAVDLATGTVRVLARGVFTPALLGAGGRYVMVGRITARLTRHELLAARIGTPFKLSKLNVEGWSSDATFYSVSSSSRAFSLWRKDHIVVCQYEG